VFKQLARNEEFIHVVIARHRPQSKDHDSYCTSFVLTSNISASGNWRRVDSFRP
jgi:hypothetical protein